MNRILAFLKAHRHQERYKIVKNAELKCINVTWSSKKRCYNISYSGYWRYNIFLGSK